MSRSAVHRLFVAIYPVEHAATRLATHGSALHAENPTQFRPVPPELLHMTLLFLGDTQERELPEATESVARSVAGIQPFTLIASTLIGLPDARNPRLVAATTDSPPGLIEVQHRLATRMARNRKDRRPGRFLPHLTIGRFSPGATGTFEAREIPPIAYEVHCVRLMRSVLRPTGAIHAEMGAFPLNGR